MPIKEELKKTKPFKTVFPSLLVTLTILTFVERDAVFVLLQLLSHDSRAYCYFKAHILKTRLFGTILTNKLHTERLTKSVLSWYGRPEAVLQML